MTYQQDEASLQDGDPIELYEFVGNAQTFYLTSAEEDVDFNSGAGLNTYFAVPIKRSPIMAKGEDSRELSVTVPVDLELAERFVFQIAPSVLTLRIFRLHQTSGFSTPFWNGPIMAWSIKERLIAFRVLDRVLSRINEEVPKFKYQQLCNNVLYDGRCAVVAASFEESGILSTFSGDGKTVTLAAGTMAPNPDGWANGGLLTHQATGEARMIITHVGDVMTIMFPFSVNVNVLDTMVVNAGCDHSLATCIDKFANVDHFTGMPFVLSQALNPTQGGD